MANREHAAVVMQGHAALRQWRNQNPTVVLDLSRANLRELKTGPIFLDYVNLTGANFQESSFAGLEAFDAIFNGVNLSGADFSGANLPGADFTNANLTRARFCNARLPRAVFTSATAEGADFSGAILDDSKLSGGIFFNSNFSGTNLSGSEIYNAKFTKVDFSDADFSRARMYSSVLADLDLSKTKGLKSVKHLAPSSVAFDTILKSKGHIPDSFLRGCGMPDDYVKFIRAQHNRPLVHCSCFISYSSKDVQFAEKLYNDLYDHCDGVWRDTFEMAAGIEIERQIEDAIKKSEKLLLILSPHSIESQ